MRKTRFTSGALFFLSSIALLLLCASPQAAQSVPDNGNHSQVIKAPKERSIYGFDPEAHLDAQGEIFKELISEQARSMNAPGRTGPWIGPPVERQP